MKNYTFARLDSNERVEFKELLGLSGCEISLNTLPAGISVPFVHAHVQNEEVYIVLEGSGKLFIDGEEIAIAKGDIFKIDPSGERCISAGDETIRFLCIQVKAGSLEQYTDTDGVLREGIKPSWLFNVK
ncbi:cupin domain-containing protein [Campylobacter sp. VBCF_06 NA8]|uniref:cupin domain-containing protein n=1 Tax=unclassified Campylobacter TaxID=2593542 RepID=UPI0022E9B732|nr:MULTISPECIES: cupin domain-containing protein [unclassified Campylobacter]MDA3043205.1 cupin domain-containing protein [Campylobacter sp. JMF_09 ED2]MDA3045106.1 cupin domain-containing protein [Campylobacter sp. JMF_07 ED4]MDA3045685.1 cupin domain-containing protein [Campylobacter sp. VBCF_06 NA8]MDA3047971.1 cupin domain-containing protein [Campylobacter sp. JMF_08 NE1]MDA3054794.1 cupin domain-containing protein [Campylobacter sp. VBCF_07 NA4]